jgi:hypothetical protein
MIAGGLEKRLGKWLRSDGEGFVHQATEVLILLQRQQMPLKVWSKQRQEWCGR